MIPRATLLVFCTRVVKEKKERKEANPFSVSTSLNYFLVTGAVRSRRTCGKTTRVVVGIFPVREKWPGSAWPGGGKGEEVRRRA